MRDNAPNLAPNDLIFAERHVVLAGAATGRFTRKIERRQFAEAFLLVVTNPPTLVTTPATTPKVMELLVQPQVDAATGFAMLPNSPLIVNPGCPFRFPLPGWVERLDIDLRGVSGADLTTQVDITARIALYRMERTTRVEEHA